MPTYKLHYFDIRGIAEPIRYMLHYAGTKFDDERTKFEEWPAKKQSTPFKQLPYLEVDGQMIGQSGAIMKFLAKRLNLAGNSDIEQAQVDALADYVVDARNLLRPAFREQDPTKKKEIQDKFFADELPNFLTVLEEHLKKNNGGNGFLVGKEVTYADIVVGYFGWMMKEMRGDALDKYPLLKAHMERVNNLKGIKEWIATRPVTTM